MGRRAECGSDAPVQTYRRRTFSNARFLTDFVTRKHRERQVSTVTESKWTERLSRKSGKSKKQRDFHKDLHTEFSSVDYDG